MRCRHHRKRLDRMTPVPREEPRQAAGQGWPGVPGKGALRTRLNAANTAACRRQRQRRRRGGDLHLDLTYKDRP